MFIQTEETPNPATLKFLPGRVVLPTGTANFVEAGSAGHSPLAQRLFEIDGVTGVFLGYDFVSVTKQDAVDWYQTKPAVMGVIMDAYASGLPVLTDHAAATPESTSSEEDSELVSQIKELIDTRVRPAVAQDGGDIVFQGFEDGVVYLHMQGACAGCPSSAATLQSGIENMLRHYIPEVARVQAV